LKTSREFGCGLGQHTVAYNADGSVRFDSIAESRKLDPSLANWRDCYDVQMNLRATVLKLKQNNRQCALVTGANRDVKACSAATYNGGWGTITKRIHACETTTGCDKTKWFGHLEHQCKSKSKAAGYGEDFCTINSKYPGRVEARMPKYEGR
jgi:hypothetical protein